jgi:hypothetical protein
MTYERRAGFTRLSDGSDNARKGLSVPYAAGSSAQ